MSAGLFDTHAHFEGTPDETRAALERAFAAGVTRVMAVGGSETLNRGVRIARDAARDGAGRTPEVFAAVGWDRDQCGRCELPPLDFTDANAVGEIGLDYHYSPETRTAQTELMARQLELARDLALPVLIHTRDADGDTLGLLREIPSKGIIHCFTGSPSFCRDLLDLGFYISISGIVTFRAADNVRESALVVPDDRLLVETDSPFLAPVPMRGGANEPAYVVHTARFLADLRKVPYERLVESTTANALRILSGAGVGRPGSADARKSGRTTTELASC